MHLFIRCHYIEDVIFFEINENLHETHRHKILVLKYHRHLVYPLVYLTNIDIILHNIQTTVNIIYIYYTYVDVQSYVYGTISALFPMPAHIKWCWPKKCFIFGFHANTFKCTSLPLTTILSGTNGSVLKRPCRKFPDL